MIGRPSSFTPEIADSICEHLVEGESLRRICKRAGMPSVSTVIRWLADDAHEGFRRQYAHAREAQADTLADEALYIADTQKRGTVTVRKQVDGVESTEVRAEDMLGHRRLQVDTRKWYAAKLAPKKYGLKVDLAAAVSLVLPSDVMDEAAWSEEFAPKP